MEKDYFCNSCGLLIGGIRDYGSWNVANHECEEMFIMDGQPKLDGKKNDSDKPKLGLVSKVFIWGIAEILTIGAKLYGEHNWREGLAWSRPYNALLRHLTAWWDGEDIDKESGKSHLWHAGAELMFLAEYEAKGTGKDDRFKAK